MPVVSDIISFVHKLAPEESAEPWDNVGLIVGDFNAPVNNVLLSLDCTEDCIRQAVEKKAELIITHHSVIFKALNKINSQTGTGRRLLILIKNGIAVYSAHTNLDIAENGTNDTLFNLLMLKDKEPLTVEGVNIGRIGKLEKKYTLKEFSRHTASVLNSEGISFIGNEDFVVNRIGICTGGASGAKYMDAAAQSGCDVYLTGDVSYHQAQYAADIGLCLINVPHYATEVLVIDTLEKYLTDEAAASMLNVRFYKYENQKDIFNYI